MAHICSLCKNPWVGSVQTSRTRYTVVFVTEHDRKVEVPLFVCGGCERIQFRDERKDRDIEETKDELWRNWKYEATNKIWEEVHKDRVELDPQQYEHTYWIHKIRRES